MAAFIKREYDYAIRICAYLAGTYKKSHKSVSELSKKLFITTPFATKIVHKLKNGKLIETVQGKHGGIKLAKNPDGISLFDVLNTVGFDSTINECLKIPGMCPLNVTCKIHKFFIQQEQILIQSLKNTVLSEFKITDNQLFTLEELKSAKSE